MGSPLRDCKHGVGEVQNPALGKPHQELAGRREDLRIDTGPERLWPQEIVKLLERRLDFLVDADLCALDALTGPGDPALARLRPGIPAGGDRGRRQPGRARYCVPIRLRHAGRRLDVRLGRRCRFRV